MVPLALREAAANPPVDTGGHKCGIADLTDCTSCRSASSRHLRAFTFCRHWFWIEAAVAGCMQSNVPATQWYMEVIGVVSRACWAQANPG